MAAKSPMSITRLAPSPTGALHLGNARTFLVNWLLARQQNWGIILRAEDLDGPRVKPGADHGMIEDLRWLGLDWDKGPIYQSRRTSHYDQALETLRRKGLTYPCICSRKEVEEAASAPHADGAAVYPGTCRGRFASREQALQESGRSAAIRFLAPAGRIQFEDALRGICQYDSQRDLGDFVIQKGDGTAAYQLAVVADDLEMGVTHIVRGDDLLESTARQQLIYDALGRRDAIPWYMHLPLVVGTDGRRLAKRHGDTRLAYYREAGVRPGKVVALLARWCGIDTRQQEISARDLLAEFNIANLPRSSITFSAEADAELVSSVR
jgi:glutamyl-tRNA synthetase